MCRQFLRDIISSVKVVNFYHFVKSKMYVCISSQDVQLLSRGIGYVCIGGLWVGGGD